MLAKGLRSHSLYNNAGYILSYIEIVYKPRNIPVQVYNCCLYRTLQYKRISAP
jgi:hypothetical protein